MTIVDEFASLTFPVTTTANSGAGSLRQAILDANTAPGNDLITFAIPGAGPHTIAPLSALPAITSPVTIDGTTQAGFDGVPIIELDGTNAGGGASGLFITAGNSIVRGLVVNRFGTGGPASQPPASDGGAGIVLAGAGNNVDRGQFHRHRPDGHAREAEPHRRRLDERSGRTVSVERPRRRGT